MACVLVLAALPAGAQQPVRPTDSAGVSLLPSAFASADGIAAQTAALIHGGLMGWNAATGKWDRLQLDSSDNLKVIIQNASLAVTGTFWQATQPVSGTVTANIGTTNGLALDTSINGILNAQGSTTSGQKGPLGQCAVTAGAPTYTTAQTDPLSCDTGGNLRTSVNNTVTITGSATANQGTANTLANAWPAKITDGTNTMPTGDAAARSIHTTIDNTTVAEVGTLGDNGAAATTNRVGVLPCLAASLYTSQTAGRDTGCRTGASSGLVLTASLPEPTVPSYSASAVVASAASATDIAVLPGNASNTVLVTEVHVSCTQTTAGMVELHLTKRSTADTLGTSSAMTKVPDDSNYAAASSAPLTYTANPTLGTAVGDLDIVKLGCMATGTTAPNDLYIGNFRQKPIVLRGTAQQLAISLNGATVTGGSFAVIYKWIETTGP